MKNNNIVTNKTPHALVKSPGLATANAVEWEVRYSVTKKIIETVKNKSTSVAQLAKDSGILRGRITRILKDDTFGISLDVLFKVLGANSQDVKMSYKKQLEKQC